MLVPPADGRPTPEFIVCPFCGAQPGEYCTLANSTVPASQTHEARLNVWREEFQVWHEKHAARVPETNTEPWFVAQYAGPCVRCRERIEPGQEIQASSAGGYRHVVCPS